MVQQFQQKPIPRTSGSIDMVVFDMDGTVIDTSGDLVVTANEARNQMGLPPLSTQLIHSCVGDALLPLIEKLFHDAPDRIQEAVRVFQQTYKRHVLSNTIPYPEIGTVFQQLRRQGIRVGILSNKPSELVRIPLYHFNLSPLLHFIYGGDSFRERKPSPRPIQRILVHFSLEPGRCVMVGDAPSDILAGREAGTRTIAVTYGFSSAQSLIEANPDIVVHSPAEILSVIGEWNGRKSVEDGKDEP